MGDPRSELGGSALPLVRRRFLNSCSAPGSCCPDSGRLESLWSYRGTPNGFCGSVWAGWLERFSFAEGVVWSVNDRDLAKHWGTFSALQVQQLSLFRAAGLDKATIRELKDVCKQLDNLKNKLDEHYQKVENIVNPIAKREREEVEVAPEDRQQPRGSQDRPGENVRGRGALSDRRPKLVPDLTRMKSTRMASWSGSTNARMLHLQRWRRMKTRINFLVT